MAGVYQTFPVCERDLVPDPDSVGLGNNTSIANIDIVTTSEIFTCSNAEGDVKIACCIGSECMGTLDSIRAARRVSKKCKIAAGRIVVTGRIAKQCSYSSCCIVKSDSVAEKRRNTESCIPTTRGVGK